MTNNLTEGGIGATDHNRIRCVSDGSLKIRNIIRSRIMKGLEYPQFHELS